MKKVFFFLIIVTSFYGCKKDTFEIKGDPMNLIVRDNTSYFTKSVILLDDDNYLIKTPLDTFILGHPFNLADGYYNAYKTKAVNDGLSKNTLIGSDYMPYEGEIVYTLSYHLEKGSCYMWDKHLKKSIKTIYIERYWEGGPMSSTGGRRFYVRDKLFLTTVDFISK